MPEKSAKALITTAFVLYFLSLAASFTKIYIFHAYPIYLTEESIPSISEQIKNAINFNYR